jgi:ribonuclease T1
VKKILKNTFFVFLFISQLLVGCRQTQNSEQNYKAPEANNSTEQKADFKKKSPHKNTQSSNNQQFKDSKTPQKVYEVLKYVRENDVALDGYVGGRRFGNFENLLPKKDQNGRRINYQEWDVNPKQQGRNRGTERLITGSDGKAYFTNNHYKSFVEVEDK